MKQRVWILLAVLAATAMLAAGCAASSHSNIFSSLSLDTDGETGYRWLEGEADMTSRGEMNLLYLTLAEDQEAEIFCSLARHQERGDIALYYMDPEGVKTLLGDTTGKLPNPNTVTLKAGSGHFYLRSEEGRYDVGLGLDGLREENILYLKIDPPPAG